MELNLPGAVFLEEKEENILYHLLVSNKLFETKGKIIRDYNDKIDSILKLGFKKLSNEYV